MHRHLLNIALAGEAEILESFSGESPQEFINMVEPKVPQHPHVGAVILPNNT